MQLKKFFRIVKTFDSNCRVVTHCGQYFNAVEGGPISHTRTVMSVVAYLVLALEHEHVGDAAEGDAQVDDLGLRYLVGDVADVDHLGRLVLPSPSVRFVQLRLQNEKKH